MDLYVTFPGSVQPIYIDVSIRCPHAQRYTHAASIPGVAASAAAVSKRERYGSAVLPVAVESYGRIGSETLHSLDLLATHAGCSLRDAWAAPRLLPRWRAALERIVQYASADVDLLALGCAPTAAEARVAYGRVMATL